MSLPAAPSIQVTIAQTVQGMENLGPEMVLLAGFLLVLGLDLLPFPWLRRLLSSLALLVLVVCLVWQVLQIAQVIPFYKGGLFGGMLYQDGLTLGGSFLFSLAGIFAVFLLWISQNTTKTPVTTSAEFYAVLLAVVLGLNLLVRSSNLLMLFLSLELVSVGSYLLVLLRRLNPNRVEAGLKYILYGAFASGVMLYGLSFLYGLTGTLQFQEVAFWQALQTVPPLLLVVVWGLVLAGLLFKLAAFPFQFWAPDVYEAAPTAVVAFFSTAPKLAAALVLYRLIQPVGGQAGMLAVPALLLLLQVATAFTLVFGNFTALWQKSGKRLMAYSSIAHTGFLLLILLSGSTEIDNTLLFYGVLLLIGNFGAFLVMGLLEQATGSGMIEDWGGMGGKHPWLRVGALVVFISLIGLPPAGGFIAKLLVFFQLWQTYQATADVVWLGLLVGGVLLTAVALYYYLRIPFYLFFRENETEEKIKFPLGAYVFLPVLCTVVLLFFFKAGWLTEIIEHVLSFSN